MQATFALGVLYAEGRGVKKDRAKSAELFEKAARTGHPLANYNLGLLFLKGDGKPQNPYRAAMHIRYAAEKGIAVAQYDLAGLYQNGAGVEPNAVEAARWLSKAAEQGMADAQFDYAVLLLRGLGLTKDEPKAVPLSARRRRRRVSPARRTGSPTSIAEGVGVKKSPEEAAKWRLIAQAGGLKDDDARCARRQAAEGAAGGRAAGRQRMAREGRSVLKRPMAPCQRGRLRSSRATCASAAAAPQGSRRCPPQR